MALYSFIRPALFALDPETAHNAALKALSLGIAPHCCNFEHESLRIKIAGLELKNPIGLAAGFDKNAAAIDGIARLGFGAIEVGTLTPKAQCGNTKPRQFRLVEDKAVINRLGFNNEGHKSALPRIIAAHKKGHSLGVNIGANKDSDDRIHDYVTGIKTFAHHASYLTINISSPNTPGLRDLQEANQLDDLLARCFDAREQTCEGACITPLFVKLAPDLDESSLDAILKTVITRKMDGLILTNTTIARPETLQSPYKSEAGGLSGAPLFASSTRLLAQTHLRLGNQLPLIGVGGVHSVETLWQKIAAGATMVQLYSGMIYEGPHLITELKRGLHKRLIAEKITLEALRGNGARDLAH